MLHAQTKFNNFTKHVMHAQSTSDTFFSDEIGAVGAIIMAMVQVPR